MTQRNEKRKYTLEELLDEQGYLIYTTVGISMMPLLRQQRDLVEIHKKDRPIRKYDVALYKRNGRYILHRCIEVTPEGYVFAGDHSTYKEYDVTDNMIIGLMERVIRNGKDINLSSISYRLYSHLWVDFFQVKVILLKSKRFFQRLGRITPSKLKNYLNWKTIRLIDCLIDYRITGQDLTKNGKDSLGTGTQYKPVNYLAINETLSRVELSDDDRIIDIGCGKGRVLAYLLSKNCPCQMYGIEDNKTYANTCIEWTKKYNNVHVICGDVFSIDYDNYSVLYLNRSFPGQEAFDFIHLLEKQVKHPITVVHPFEQSSGSVFENRSGWILQNSKVFLKTNRLQVVRTPRRCSVWIYTPPGVDHIS